MKRFSRYAPMALALFCATACPRTRQPVNNDATGPAHFSTAEEAAGKAKSDLLAVLRSGKAANLGVDEAAVASSQPGPLVKHYQITFDSLLSTDPAAAFARSAQSEMATVVPFVSGNSVVVVAGIARDDKGWRVTSLVDQGLSNDLNALRGVAGAVPQGEVVIYDLPHAAAKVYSMKQNGSELFYSDYPGFNVREGVSAERLFLVLRKDAAAVQQEHGTALKEKKVVR